MLGPINHSIGDGPRLRNHQKLEWYTLIIDRDITEDRKTVHSYYLYDSCRFVFFPNDTWT